MIAFHTLALTTLIQKGASQGISEGTAIIVAAVGGALLAAVLQTLGAFLINFLTARREDRAAARESEKRHEQWEREDQLRREEQKEAAQQRRQAHRVEAYRKFAAATAFAIPLDEDRRAEQLAKLTETHTEVQAHGSSDVRDDAASLYERAYRALYTDPEGNVGMVRINLDTSRGHFWDSISRAQEEEDQE
jgi:hypothetical protein